MNFKITPVWQHKDGRKCITVRYEDGTKKSMAYARWLVEQYLGRELGKHETIDHINRDKLDDRLENLRIVPQSQHSSDDTRRVKLVEVTCKWCGATAYKRGKDLRANSKKNKAGPFCGRSCGAKYGRQVQLGNIEALPVQPSPASEYYFVEKVVKPLK